MNRAFKTSRRRGTAAVLAMLFLVMMTTLSVAMFSLETTNTQTAYNLTDVSRAQAAAEAGVRWMTYRFEHSLVRPKTLKGIINSTTADTLWTGGTGIQQAIINDMASMTTAAERPCTTTSTSVTTSPISMEANGANFQVTVAQKTSDHTVLTVSSTGSYKNASRTVSMDFQIEKKIKFAIVGRVPIQLGRNTIVEGPVAMVTDSLAKGPPVLMLSDFTHLDAALTSTLNAWNTFLQSNHNGYDNRISVNNPQEFAAATTAGYTDYNGDAYIDEYDMFLQRFDSDHDKAISTAEFTNPSTGKLYDAQLFAAMDSINGPMYAGDTARLGYQDGKIDNHDGYAKLRGSITMAVTTTEWNNVLTDPSRDTAKFPWTHINDYLQGTVAPTDPEDIPVQFGATAASMVDLSPTNFEQCAANFQTQSGTFAGATSKTATVIKNAVLSAADANGGTVVEESPKGSGNFQAVYKRPVFQNMTFKNVTIPKGLNALFKNCKFQGVTYVTTEHDIVTSSGVTTYDDSTAGMSWAQRATSGAASVSLSGSFKDTNGDGKWDQYKVNGMSSFTNITSWDSSGNPVLPAGAGSYSYGTGASDKKSLGSTKGNNLRFDGCQIEGPIAGNYATDYTHFANSWEFTGATLFNNQVDQTATIVSPQVNIEMGSFTDPTQAPSTMIGVVVAGNIDIRGSSSVDGSIIVTGNGAGNTTLAYFGASDSDTNPTADPLGGYGKLNIRYNPTRALPDGINIAVDLTPVITSYSEEAAQCLN